MKLVLASGSPRRRELLAGAGVAFAVAAADLDESWPPGESPADHCARLAAEKATAVSVKFPDDLCLGADTIVVIDGRVLGKPRDRGDGARMLATLAGRTHEVLTAVALARGGAVVERFTGRAAVTFHALDERQRNWYLASDEPWDKAGGYAAQGKGAALIEKIEGDFYTVVGLPLAATLRALQRHGIAVFGAGN